MEARSIDDYAAILWRRRWLTLLIVATCSATTYGISAMQPPLYESYTEFYWAGMTYPTGSYVGMKPVLWALTNTLMPDPFSERNSSYEGMLEGGELRRQVHERVPEKPEHEFANDVEVAAGGENTLFVRVRDGDPDVAARVANAYPEALDAFLNAAAAPQQHSNLLNAEQAVARARRALEQAGADLQQLQEQTGVLDAKLSSDEAIEHRIELEQGIEERQRTLRSLERRIVAMEERLQAELGRSRPSSSRTADRTARTSRAARTSDRALSADELDEHVTRAQRAPEEDEPDSLADQLRREIVDHYVERAGLEGELGAYEGNLRVLGAATPSNAGARLREELQRAERTRAARMLESAALYLAEVQIQVERRPSRIVVLHKGYPNPVPVLPCPVTDTVIMGAIGLLVSLYIACGLENPQHRGSQPRGPELQRAPLHHAPLQDEAGRTA